MRLSRQRFLVLVAGFALLGACGTRDDAESVRGQDAGAPPPAQQATETPRGDAQTGTATVYAGMLEGQQTAGGEPFSHDELVAAHRTHPLGTQVRVTNLENDRSTTVRIVDRTPSGAGAIIDLSRRAARDLGIGEQGTAEVRVEVVN